MLLDRQLVDGERSAFYQLRLLHYLKPFLEKKDLTPITFARVTSTLNYCNVLYLALHSETAQKLQLVQTAAACVLLGVGRLDSIPPIYRSRTDSQ